MSDEGSASTVPDPVNASDAGGEATFDFEQTFEDVKDKHCKVEKLSIAGLQRTKSRLVLRELLKVKEADTLDEIKDSLLAAYENMLCLDIFDGVELVIDTDDEGKPDKCSVAARFVEKNILRIHGGTYVQGTEGSVEASVNLTNPFGYAEQISATVEKGSQSTNTYTLSVTRPRPRGLPVLLDLRLQQLSHCYQASSSFSEQLRGGAVTVTSEDGQDAFCYELGWRRLTNPSRLASAAVRQQLGDELKSSVKYIARRSTLDDPAFPTSGYGLRFTSEIAGLGTDAKLLRYVKHHITGQVAFPLMGSSASLVLSAEAGCMLPWGVGALRKPTAISDRFFLGGVGAGALRGFQLKGVGPTDLRRQAAQRDQGDGRQLRDFLGGDVVCSLLASINFPSPIPAMRAAGMHGHLFLNGGNMVLLGGTGKGLRESWQEFATTFRWTIGAGLVWPTRIGRLELNVCQVLASQEHDRVKRGVQFGFTPPAF